MHKNNFDFLRLLFATLVMVTHCYALTGHGNNDFFKQFTGGQIELSYLGVRGFFIISGFLIFQSLERSRDVIDYFWKRLLRLFPALLVMLVLTVLVGAIVYDGSDGNYWSKKDAWTYFPKNATLYMMQGKIKGVFEANPAKGVVNGALWTIAYEFTCYMALAALIVVRKRKLLVQMLLGVAFVGFLVANQFFFKQLHDVMVLHFLVGDRTVALCTYFVAGALLAALHFEQMKGKEWLALAAFVAILIATLLGEFMTILRFVCLPIIVIAWGLRATPYLSDIGKKIGDMSYGIYIYGFVVQQVLVHYFGLGIWSLMAISIPLTYLLGYGSWHLIEKRALKLKNVRPTAWVATKLGMHRQGEKQ
jgi:peptidoglycan/LPS O-acetylase OafA/YrhL